MINRILIVIMLALLWMALTAQMTLDGFLLGVVLSVGILWMLHLQGVGTNLRLSPVQLIALIRYTILLLLDVFLSSVGVARRLLHPRHWRQIPLKSGIIAVPTQDKNEVIAALSALSITLTPGELVVDFDGIETMYVHCLDVDECAPTANTRQAERIKQLRIIWGFDAWKRS